jgi:hypothetical protein
MRHYEVFPSHILVSNVQLSTTNRLRKREEALSGKLKVDLTSSSEGGMNRLRKRGGYRCGITTFLIEECLRCFVHLLPMPRAPAPCCRPQPIV